MEPEENGNKNGGASFVNSTAEIGAGGGLRAMSVDMPDADEATMGEPREGRFCSSVFRCSQQLTHKQRCRH
jgi:hypothetical protein